MDEFKQNECVICFENFTRGVSVRKLPTCRHLFHTSCIDNWFKTHIADASQRCPLCNGEVTIEKVKQAIAKKREEKRNRKEQSIMPIMRQFDVNRQDYSEGPSNLSMTRSKLVMRPQ